MFYNLSRLLTQHHNANHVISFSSLEVMKQNTPNEKKNKLAPIRIHTQNLDNRQKSIDLSKCSASSNCNDTMCWRKWIEG